MNKHLTPSKDVTSAAGIRSGGAASSKAGDSHHSRAIVNLLYNIVDRIYIGHMPVVGDIALTGVGLCFPVVYLLSALRP